jgi:hypothetical protein
MAVLSFPASFHGAHKVLGYGLKLGGLVSHVLLPRLRKVWPVSSRSMTS